MRKLVEYPTPSLAERDRRWAAVRKEMEARGLDCLILCGWPAMWDFNIANARYLCPIGGNAEFNVLVFPHEGEPTSFIYSPVFTDYWRGAQNFGNTAYNSRVLAWLTGGESLHNNHHAFPRSPKFSLRRSELDPSWIAIRVLAALRLLVVVEAPLKAPPTR